MNDEKRAPQPADEQPDESAPVENQPLAESTDEQPAQIGPVIGIIIILVVLILGGLYFYGSQIAEREDTQPTAQQQEQAPSDDIQSIEQDLQNTELEDLDRELEQFDQELGF